MPPRHRMPIPILRSGPMVGYSTHRAVAVWVQTHRAADVQLRYWSVTPADSATQNPGIIPDPDTAYTAVHHVTAAEDHIAQFTIAHLEPGNTYAYDLIIDNQTVQRPYPLRFQTQPLWEWRTDPPAFTAAIGSCTYINDPTYDRPGDPYGGDYQIFSQIAAQNPDLMLWMGDNVYYREVDWASPPMMAYRYAHTRATPEMQALLGHTHNYATWDDHDYGPNNTDRSYPLKGVTLDIFKRYWANPTYGLPDVPGVFGKFSWADIDFFVLDDRYHRSPTRAPRDSSKTMWGEAQLTWLIDALTTSRAPFKVVVNGGQILNAADESETLVRFPRDRQRLLDALRARHLGRALPLGRSPLHRALALHAGGAVPAVRVHEFTAHRRLLHARREQPVSPDRNAGYRAQLRHAHVLRPAHRPVRDAAHLQRRRRAAVGAHHPRTGSAPTPERLMPTPGRVSERGLHQEKPRQADSERTHIHTSTRPALPSSHLSSTVGLGMTGSRSHAKRAALRAARQATSVM